MASPLIGPMSTYPGPRRRYKDWTLWAEDGLVFMEDQTDGTVKVLTRKEAVEKIMGFASEANNWDKKKQEADPQKRAYAIDYHGYLRNLIDILREVIREATEQGDPTDDRVRRHKLTMFLRGKQASLIGSGPKQSVSQVVDALLNPPQDPIVFTADSPWLARGPKHLDERRQ